MIETTTKARVFVNLATEADDGFIWNKLEDMLQYMYFAGPLAVIFSYFGEEGARTSRPLMSTRWATDPDDMRALLDHARHNCVCGYYTHIDDVLAEALKESEEGPLQAVVIFGDRFSGDHEAALAQARQLYAGGARVFIFAETGKSAGGGAAAKAIAEAGGGVRITYNPNVERIADRLPRFFNAIGHYAIGGSDALKALTNQSATLLLEQMPR
jgi:hypothetical protein